MVSPITATTTRRLCIRVQGIVQGVGFRPFVYGQALRCGLGGSVLNDSNGVTIEVEGEAHALNAFCRALEEEAPPLARLDSIAIDELPLKGETTFVIAHSRTGTRRQTLVSPDTAVCDDCLGELFDPSDRRYSYPFINCTNCGPRFTIVQDVPYDRASTTMRVFVMCPACRAEYDDPLNRRFHAQPNCCPACGPHIRLLDAAGKDDAHSDPIVAAAKQLAEGAILAVKGLGGYHLACDAFNAASVGQLRRRKRREAKPFALMVPDLETARQICDVSDEEAALLRSRKRPIVLLKKRSDCLIAEDVASHHTSLGVMLPYTPVHHLLLRAFAQCRSETTLDPQNSVLVMTSGNLSDEPIAWRDDDACERLAAIADGMLVHDRDIHIRCDDSVTRLAAGGEQIFRRSRGYAPEPITLPFDCPVPLLACGGHLKNTFCLAKGRQAFVSHYIGDLENMETLTSFREGIEHFQRLFDIYPEAVAYDLHPEYLATKYALDLDIPRKVGVQHHHAHIAAVIAEHGLDGEVIGVAADGTGYGADGAIWGCEVMIANLGSFRRLAHLAYVPMPGGEQAVRQPWRMAAVYLTQAYGESFRQLDLPFVHQLDWARWRPMTQMMARGINSPPTSSLGRLFDAVAALLGVRGEALYEGQAAIEMEMLAEPASLRQAYPFIIDPAGHDDQTAIIDPTPMIYAIVEDIQRGTPLPQIAGCFHRTVAEMLAATCYRARAETGLSYVALSGGVFQNRLLLEQTMERLQEMEFKAYINRRLPPNDGGLSFGQLAVAATVLGDRYRR